MLTCVLSLRVSTTPFQTLDIAIQILLIEKTTADVHIISEYFV